MSAIERLAGAVRRHGERQMRFHSKEPQIAVVQRTTPLQVELTNANLVLDTDDLTLTQSVRKYERDFGLSVGDTVVVQQVSSGEWVLSSVVSEKDKFQGADASATMGAGSIGGGAVSGGGGGTVAGTPTVGTVPFRDADGTVIGRIPLIAP